jgi:hypothetical protein
MKIGAYLVGGTDVPPGLHLWWQKLEQLLKLVAAADTVDKGQEQGSHMERLMGQELR